jgi:hypothetical protein
VSALNKFDAAIVARLLHWKQNPVDFVLEGIGAKPSSQQIELLQAAPHAKRISIRSGHGTGKDAAAAWLILWFELTNSYPKVICTAPTARQLQDILWSEISKWLRQSVFHNFFCIQRDKIYLKECQKEWWVRGVTANVKASAEDQAETIAGFHAPNMLIVIDEASGVPDPVFIPLEGAMTQENNRVLLIGNMTRNSGYFYDTQYHAEISKQWVKLHWDSRKSTNVKPEMVKYFADKYGIDSDVYRVRVVGDAPSSNTNSLIPLAWAVQCVGNDILVAEDEPLYLGVDVARFGDDDSVILPRKGNEVRPWITYNGMNVIDIGSNVRLAMNDLGALGAAIDEIGVGAGTVDWLHKCGLTRQIFGVNVAMKSTDRTKYDKLRDELWWMVREKCMKAQYSFPDIVVQQNGMSINLGQELANELASPLYTYNVLGGIDVESKKQMKARGVKSPNIADALCLSEYFQNIAYSLWAPRSSNSVRVRSKLRPGETRAFPGAAITTSDSWMYL